MAETNGEPVVLEGGQFDGADVKVIDLAPLMWVRACPNCGLHIYVACDPIAENMLRRLGAVAYHRDRWSARHEATIYVIDPDASGLTLPSEREREPVAA
jgi:hypothetical protein